MALGRNMTTQTDITEYYVNCPGSSTGYAHIIGARTIEEAMQHVQNAYANCGKREIVIKRYSLASSHSIFIDTDQ
jgi:hypothetical protein